MVWKRGEAMDIQPKLAAARFEQLEAGTLFIFPFKSGPSFALKVRTPGPAPESLILPMGPIFPDNDAHQPRLLRWQAQTTVSFGKDYIFSAFN